MKFDALYPLCLPNHHHLTFCLLPCNHIFSETIARFANLSFSEGCFPSRFKSSQVTPRIKKEGLDKNEPGNYRPISNLNTISKIIERLFFARISLHVLSSRIIIHTSQPIVVGTTLRHPCYKRSIGSTSSSTTARPPSWCRST